MKSNIIAMLGLSLCAPAFISAQETAPAPEPAAEAVPAQPAPPSDAEIKDVISYFLGYQTGNQLAQISDGPIRVQDLDPDVFFHALEDGLKNRVDPKYDRPDLGVIMQAYTDKLAARNAELAQENAAVGKAFLEENAKKDGVVTTPSGLQYKVISPSDGRKYDAAKDGESALASITYEGRLIDGTVFDKADKPIDMPIDAVVPGFSEALKLIPIGAEWEVYIPSELAYGEHGPGVLGANATLIFKLKLHDIKPKKGSGGNPIQLTPEMIQQLQEAGMQPM